MARRPPPADGARDRPRQSNSTAYLDGNRLAGSGGHHFHVASQRPASMVGGMVPGGRTPQAGHAPDIVPCIESTADKLGAGRAADDPDRAQSQRGGPRHEVDADRRCSGEVVAQRQFTYELPVTQLNVEVGQWPTKANAGLPEVVEGAVATGRRRPSSLPTCRGSSRPGSCWSAVVAAHAGVYPRSGVGGGPGERWGFRDLGIWGFGFRDLVDAPPAPSSRKPEIRKFPLAISGIILREGQVAGGRLRSGGMKPHFDREHRDDWLAIFPFPSHPTDSGLGNRLPKFRACLASVWATGARRMPPTDQPTTMPAGSRGRSSASTRSRGGSHLRPRAPSRGPKRRLKTRIGRSDNSRTQTIRVVGDAKPDT